MEHEQPRDSFMKPPLYLGRWVQVTSPGDEAETHLYGNTSKLIWI